MNPYFTDADLVQRVIAAAKRGVEVRIVVSKTANNSQATAALKYYYGSLIHAGAQIWEYPAPWCTRRSSSPTTPWSSGLRSGRAYLVRG